ncbi:unnamed protein product [Lactuca saligna]|uniref:Uncharacterized protein n=1 Tax=Lactuca saligna TaxID=75948 RepID=A0AA35YHP3_LACSI|nr:unnamed protein product [Lactuca saligna]
MDTTPGFRIFRFRVIQIGNDPFRGGGCQSAEGTPRIDVFPLRNDVIEQTIAPRWLEHKDLNQKAELTLKGVVGTIIKKYFPRLTQSQRVLFEASPFGIFLGMHIPSGDPLLVYMMMLYEVRSQQIFEMGGGGVMFDIQGIQLDFGETEYILICGLKVGPYVDSLNDEKGHSNSHLRAWLFPDISDSRLRLKDLEDLILSPNYSALQDEDVVMLIQLVFMLKGLHGRDETGSIETC